MELGEKLLEIRIKKDITQVKAAELLEVNQSFLSRIEHGKKKPSLELLEKAAKIYNVPLSTFFIEDGDIEHLKTEKNMTFIDEMSKLDLNELIKKYEIVLDGKELDENEIKSILSFVRTIRNT